jgi:hypothetical protein
VDGSNDGETTNGYDDAEDGVGESMLGLV